VDGHELLGQAEVVAGLLLVIGEQIAVTAANGEAVERGEHKVGGLPILLGPAAHYEVVERRAVGAPGVEGAGEQVLAVGLPAVEPAQPAEELRRSDDPVAAAGLSHQSASSSASASSSSCSRSVSTFRGWRFRPRLSKMRRR